MCNSELQSMQISNNAVLPVVPSCVIKMPVNPIIQPKTRLINQAQTSTHVTIYFHVGLWSSGL
jgi:hypothetical protein